MLTYSEVQYMQVSGNIALMHPILQLGGVGSWNMALFGVVSAYPHGTSQPQKIEEGQIDIDSFGVRLEDSLYMTESGPAWFSESPDSLDSPLGKMG